MMPITFGIGITVTSATCLLSHLLITGKGGKNRRRGKNENESEKRELVFKEDGQGECMDPLQPYLTCKFSKQVLTSLSIWPAP